VLVVVPASYRSPPNIYFKKKKTGGVSINSTMPLTKMDEKMVQRVLQEYKIHNCEVTVLAGQDEAQLLLAKWQQQWSFSCRACCCDGGTLLAQLVEDLRGLSVGSSITPWNDQRGL
jgi:hypothetical protein